MRPFSFLNFFNTEEVGFEPTGRFRDTHAFQACSFGRSDIPPYRGHSIEQRLKLCKQLPTYEKRKPSKKYPQSKQCWPLRAGQKNRNTKSL